ncbi:MAG: polyprenyl synthetase family protein [Pyrinomonadaceae bacterium]
MISEKTENEISGRSDLWQYVEKYRTPIEENLRKFLPLAPPNIETEFNEALEYALFPGGKRLRPVLTLLGAEIIGGDAKKVLPAAMAAEFIHSSSLIFDDLPCMDNSAERRGKVSQHEKYGEGLAILVALGLLNASYALVFVNHLEQPERTIAAHAEIVECVGASGMVGGQSVDLALAKGAAAAAIDSPENDYAFESSRNLKTSALMRLALRVGAILAGADYLQLKSLSRFAELLGDAYQLSDDLLDLQEDGAIFETQKNFTQNYGQETARLRLISLTEKAKRTLTENFSATEAQNCLLQMTDYLVERKS